MDVNSFLSPYLKAKDIQKKGPFEYTISAVKAETVGRGEDAEEKLVLYFKETKQGLVLNKTNLGILTELFDSDDSDDFIGKKVAVTHDPNVRYGGKRVGGVKLAATK